MKNTTATFLAAWCCSVAATAALARAGEPCFKIVVHRSNPTAELASSKTSRMFLKRITKWPDGTRIVPVDLKPQSPIRKQFSRTIHGKSVTAIKSYWQRMIFSGRDVPPQELAGDREVLDFVRHEPGAIGYVDCTHTGAPGVTTFDAGLRNDDPIFHAGVRGGHLWLGDGDSEEVLAAAIPTAIDLPRTETSRTVSSWGELRILHTGSCGTGGRWVFLHSRLDREVAIEIRHRITDGDTLRFRDARTHKLPAGGLHYLGCSKDGSFEHAFILGDLR